MFFFLFLFIITISFATERYLSYLNSTYFNKPLPSILIDFFDVHKYRNLQEYLNVQYYFSIISDTFSFLLTFGVITFGILGILDNFLLSLQLSPVVHALLFFGILAIASDILTTPFSYYATFNIEERFGFNKTTRRTFFLDKIKGWLIAAIIGSILISSMVWFYEKTGPYFWLYAWILLTLFMLLITIFYSDIIVPLFNKQKPLEEGELRTAIEAFSNNVGFTLDNIYVIDGSKRSSKANAYFSGLGKKKRIVLFDTLIQKHTTEELIAVLAHEIGHYKLKHTLSSMVLSIINIGIMLFLLSLFINKESQIAHHICNALGTEKIGFHIGLFGFFILYSPFSLLMGLFINKLSRNNEYAADAYAATNYNADSLQLALKKLSIDNYSNLTPHPTYVFFYYSHPPLIKRLEALEKLKK